MPSVDSHCEQERADEEQAMARGSVEWDRLGRSANIGNAHSSVATPWDVEIARLRAELAARDALVRRMAERRGVLSWLGATGWRKPTDEEWQAAQAADWAELCRLAGVEVKE